MSEFIHRARVRIEDRRGQVILVVFPTHVQVCRGHSTYPVDTLDHARFEAPAGRYRIEASERFDFFCVPTTGRRTSPAERWAAKIANAAPGAAAYRARVAARDAARDARTEARYGPSSSSA